MSIVSSDRVPNWVKWLIAGGVGAGAVTGGQKLATDSPVHFATEGVEPSQHDGWACAPEGGLIGAPVVCRPAAEQTEQPEQPEQTEKAATGTAGE